MSKPTLLSDKNDKKIVLAYYDNATNTTDSKQAIWVATLQQYLPSLLAVPLQAEQTADVALVWHPPPGILATVQSLKAIISMGQGVDHILQDNNLPDVPVVRLVDKDMANAMSHWVILVMLDYLRDGVFYRQGQREKQWAKNPQVNSNNIKVAIYGVGEIGGTVAVRIHALGFDVYGWSRAQKNNLPFATYSGEAGWRDILSLADVHVNLLPLTRQTQNLFNREAFTYMKQGAYFINAGRGKTVVEADLLNAIDNKQLSGAALDVFAKEPLPPSHPFWAHPQIAVWPHVSAQTNIETSAPQVANAIAAAMSGAPIPNCVDKQRGY